MEYAHAVLALAENDRELSEQNITAVLEAADADVSPSRVKAFVAALEGVDMDAVNAQSLALSDDSAPGDDTEHAEEVTTDAFVTDVSESAADAEVDSHDSGGPSGFDEFSPADAPTGEDDSESNEGLVFDEPDDDSDGPADEESVVDEEDPDEQHGDEASEDDIDRDESDDSPIDGAG